MTMPSTSGITPEKAHVLDEDIYFTIFALLPTQTDVSALMRSSRLLYGLGTRRLLQMGVYIATDSDLVSFCQFMQRNLPGCAKYLTELSIIIARSRMDLDDDPDTMDDCELLDGAPLLVPIIPQLTNLQDLTIEFCEELFECDARLVDAFASLTTVRKLYVSSFGQGTHDIVKTMQSPILDLYVSAEDPGLDVFPYPFDMLEHRQATLEKVVLGFFDLDESMIEQGLSTAVFPRVSALSLMDCCIIERSVLVRAFPNVRALEVTGWPTTPGIKATKRRRAGVEDAHDLNLDDPYCWPALDHVYGDVDGLYMLGLCCPVKRLDILTDLELESVERMHATIIDTRPPRLVIRCGHPKYRWPLHFNYAVTPSSLFDLLGRGPPHVDVTHFGLDLGLKGISGDPVEYQRAIGRMLRQLPRVQFLTLRVHAVECEYEDEDDAPGPAHRSVLSRFRGDYLANCAVRFGAPMLEYVCVRLWDKDEFWHIVRANGGEPNAGAPLGLERLDVDTGRALMLVEGMDWRPAAKTPLMLTNDSDESPSEDVS